MVDAQTSDIPAWRYTAELAQDIELRWQATWDENKTFETPNPAGPLADHDAVAARGEKLFVLDMFPYPSGSGLHVGHPLGFIGTDVYSRFQRMQGRNVLYTMGFDAFGLPAEQYAVETGQHPAITTDENIANYRRQLHRIGLSHDRRRSISTTDPEYYRWTQWIFREIFESWYDDEQDKARPIAELIAQFESGERAVDGDPATQEHAGRAWSQLTATEQASVLDGHRLAYVAHAPVNWCPGLGTVVANEEVTADNRSDRGNFPVFKRTMRQWMMRITKYADRLADDLDLLDWSDAIKTMQRNWIGRSEGAIVHFASTAGPISVFTTRPDTLFGATFMVLAPEHPLVDALTTDERAEFVAAYRAAAATKNDIDRQDDTRAKTGVPTGSTATNPVTGEEVPIWIADYVLMGYGSGAIMAVPCGDQRDFEFARKFDLPIPAIQQPPAEWFEGHAIKASLDTSTWPVAYVGDAPYVQSANDSLDLNGTSDVASGVAATNAWLEANGHGEATTNYKLRDWLFSRQRYWGEPFPVVYDEHNMPHSIPADMLPVLLPETDSFSPRTFDPDDAETEPESPLSRLDDWVNVELDLGDGPKMYRRDTNVMPQWAGSCWYEMRYLDPTNTERFVNREVEKYWMGPRTDERPDHPGGVDLYVGGVEHAVLHLLYARFWHKVLYDLGHVSSLEPYARLYNQGYVMEDAFLDEREIYVEASEVERHADGTFTFEGKPVTKETGKMGKSKKNAVSPDDMLGAYGADTWRLHLMAMGPLDQSRPWNIDDVIGMYRFLQRLWRNTLDEDTGLPVVTDDAPTDELARTMHRTIDAVTTEMTHLRFNTAIAKLIELNNEVTKLDAAPRTVVEAMVLMVAPLAPHISEELWHRLGHDQTVTYTPFPVADPAMLVDDQVEYPVQVNGKVRGRVTVAADADNDTIQAAALAEENVVRTLDGNDPKKVIVIPGRTVNIVV